MRRLFAFSLLVLTAATAGAQEIPAVTISKSDRLSIHLKGVTGADGAQAAKVIQNDLSMSGYFAMSPAASAGFVVSGASSGSTLSGTVVDRAGKTILSKSYNGSMRTRAHQFADDIVETLTGNPGIANSKIAFVATRTGKKEIY